MSLLVRPNSPYYWIDIHPKDGPRIRESTKVRHDAPTPDLRRENRRLAEKALHAVYVRLATQRLEPTRDAITFTAFAAWYEANVTAHKRGAARERGPPAQNPKQSADSLGVCPTV